MYGRNPHNQRAKVGDLIAIVTGHSKYEQARGTWAWLECEVAEVVGAGENGRVKSLRLALTGGVVRRKHLPRLVALAPFPASEIDVATAMKAARDHGKPFDSLDEMRTLLRPFVLVDLTERGYKPYVAEASPLSDTPLAVAFGAAKPTCPCGCSGGPDDCTCGMRCVCTNCAYCDAIIRDAESVAELFAHRSHDTEDGA